uniref:Uncharacterized protein n=1 Tax=Acrobeloides nanus TaxID=290746 RepID=A0A914DI27_9BILA
MSYHGGTTKVVRENVAQMVSGIKAQARSDPMQTNANGPSNSQVYATPTLMPPVILVNLGPLPPLLKVKKCAMEQSLEAVQMDWRLLTKVKKIRSTWLELKLSSIRKKRSGVESIQDG